MKKIKTTIKDKHLYIFFTISILFFGIFSKVQYTTDTYVVFMQGAKNTALTFAGSGRFVTAIATCIFNVLSFKADAIYYVSFYCSIIFVSIAQYLLYSIIKKDIKNDTLSVLISTITIINPFSIELFFYIEKGVMTLSILICVIALKYIIKFFQKSQILWI